MADETTNRVTDESQLDDLIRRELTCPGCSLPLHPVPHRNVVQWTCPTFGCSRMLPNAAVEGRIEGILRSVGIDNQTKRKEAINRYRKGLLGGAK